MSGDTRDLIEALRSAGVTDVDDSTLARALYSSDASAYRVVPRVVVKPRDVAELTAVVAVAYESGTALTMRGAGTSIAGNAIGPGIVVDTARHLTRIHEVDPETARAVVDPGVVHATLQTAAAATTLRFGPDPSSHTRCTIGGMIGNNACGSRSLGYGRTVDNVVGLEAVTIGGEPISVGATRTVIPTSIESGLRDIVRSSLGTIRTEFGHFGRQLSGYSVEHLLPERGADLGRFLCGTEGTLAVITRAEVRLVRDTPARVLVVLGYPTIADAADDVPALLPLGPVACEGFGRRLVDVVTARGRAVPDLPPGDGWLFVEVTGETETEVVAAAQAVARAASPLEHRVVTTRSEQAALWRLREDGAGLGARALDRPGLPGWEDSAVPPERLGAYLRELTTLLTERGLDGVPYGHFGDGCVHLRIDFDHGDRAGRDRFRSFVADAARLVATHGGSLTGEHGDGRARSGLLPLMYSPEAVALFGAVKHAFDPENLLNPGVLVDPRPVEADLRGTGRTSIGGTISLRLRADHGDFGAAVHRCSGVGACVGSTTAPGAVMCPSFQATRNERDSTRGRARVLQEMVNGSTVTGGWRSPDVREALDLCMSCKGCAHDCPTGVDMAAYKSEVLHQAYRGRFRPRAHYTMGWLPRWLRLASRAPRLANATTRLPGAASVVRAVAGIDQRRDLPTLAPTSLRAWSRERAGATASGATRVVLWADTFTDAFAATAGRAAVAVLEAAGYRVVIPDQALCCGLTYTTTGQLDRARLVLAQTVAALAPYTADGVPIVGLEPSCTAALRSDVVELLDDPRAVQVAGAVRTLAELLGQTSGWEPPDLNGLTVVAQPHCHHASVLGWSADETLLRRAGAKVTRVGGCCGYAGSFGVERSHYDVSVAIAETNLLPAVRSAPEAVVLADGFSCRAQLDDLAGVRGLHLAELLADPRAH